MHYLKVLGLAAAAATVSFAQMNVISAKSGMIHYTEGSVFLGEKAVVIKTTAFPEMKNNDELRSELGRAELLLTPGVFLRIAENTRVRMVSNALESTRVDLLAGTALLEVGEVDKQYPIVVGVNGKAIEFAKKGLFRIEADPAQVSVYDGSAVVVADGATVTVKEGKRLLLSGVAAPERFNKESGDSFYRWASRRASYVALANIALARKIEQSNMSWNSSAWLYNPYFGSFTYMPGRGRYMCPFGYSYYSPGTVSSVYYRATAPSMSSGGVGPAASWDRGGRGYGDYGGRSSSVSNSSAGSYSPPPAASAPAAAAPARGADSGGGSRGSAGGR